jgi:hypothetical protein
MLSTVVGTLTRDVHDYWTCAAHPVPFFDGRPLRVVFEVRRNDESFLVDADAALQAFLQKDSTDREALSEPVFEMCSQFIELTGLEDTVELFRSIEEPEAWHLRVLQREAPLLEIRSPGEIWKFVDPQEILLRRFDDGHGACVYVQLLCACAWDEEHGIQIVYRNGTDVARISEQDGAVV